MATTAAEEFDAMPMNNFATQSHIVQHMTDLQTTLTQTSTAISGQTLGVQIEITNQGPSDTTDSFVTLPFPIFLSLNDLVTSQGGCTSSMGLINCELGSIANAATTTLDILFDIDSDVSLSTFSLTATASDGSDIILTNNADTLDIMLDTRVDLAVVVRRMYLIGSLHFCCRHFQFRDVFVYVCIFNLYFYFFFFSIILNCQMKSVAPKQFCHSKS